MSAFYDDGTICFELCDAAAAAGPASCSSSPWSAVGSLDPGVPASHRAHLVPPGGLEPRRLARGGLADGACLALSRRVISPIGGVDVTPVIWVGLISLVRELLVGQQGLLSQILMHAQAAA